MVNERDSVVEKEQIAPGKGIPEGNTQVFPWRDGEGKKWVMVATKKGLYEIPPLDHRRHAEGDSSGKPVLCSRFGKLFADTGRGVYKFYQQSNGDVWLINGAVAHCKKQNDGTYTIDTIPFKGVDIGAVRALSEGEDGAVWLGGVDGIGRYDPSMRADYAEPYYCLVTGVWAKPQEKEDSLLFGGFYAPGEKTAGEGPVLPYSMNHLLFRYASPFYEKEELTEYSYRLEGLEEGWSEWSNDKKKEYTNLPEGKYNFRIKARNIYGKESEEGVYAFVIKPPFHRTLLFYLYQGGGILFLFALAVVFSRFLRYGWAGVAGAMTGTVAVFVIFEYTQNFIEAEFSDVLGDVILYKVLLNVGCGLLLFPIEIVINNMLGIKVVRMWKGDKVKGLYDIGMVEGERKGKAEGLKEGEAKGYAKGFDDGKRSVER